MIRALIFDFDGLILDTEGPDYASWREVYLSLGCELSLAQWAACIGSSDTFDPYAELEAQLGCPVDREGIRQRRRARFAELMVGQTILPGVVELMAAARRLGLKLGIASSSPREWVAGYLRQFGLLERFDSLSCSDDVARTKPDPALYLTALRRLGVAPHEAIALEDSPNGVLAAKRAGIYCVAVPNALTRQLDLGQADWQLASLAQITLPELLTRADGAGPSSGTP